MEQTELTKIEEENERRTNGWNKEVCEGREKGNVEKDRERSRGSGREREKRGNVQEGKEDDCRERRVEMNGGKGGKSESFEKKKRKT